MKKLENLKVKTINSWDKLAEFWDKNGGRVRQGVLTAITATFLATSTSCTSSEQKLEQNKSELLVLIENFENTRTDALTTEKLYKEAIRNGDKISANGYKKQMNKLKDITIKKIKKIERIKMDIVNHTSDIRNNEEAVAREKTITWEDALNYRP